MFQPPNAPVRVQCTMGTPNTHAFRHQQATNRQRSATYQLTEHSLTLTILHVRGCGRVHHCHCSTAQHSIEVHADHHHHSEAWHVLSHTSKAIAHSKLLAPNSKPSSVQTSPDSSVWSSDFVSPHKSPISATRQKPHQNSKTKKAEFQICLKFFLLKFKTKKNPIYLENTRKKYRVM